VISQQRLAKLLARFVICCSMALNSFTSCSCHSRVFFMWLKSRCSQKEAVPAWKPCPIAVMSRGQYIKEYIKRPVPKGTFMLDS
jgi:hypothetical protein